MNLKARVEQLETRIGAGREQLDVYITFVPWPDPDGLIKAAGLQTIQLTPFSDVEARMEWSRRSGETEAEFVERAKREAPPPAPGVYARTFSADYREREPGAKRLHRIAANAAARSGETGGRHDGWIPGKHDRPPPR